MHVSLCFTQGRCVSDGSLRDGLVGSWGIEPRPMGALSHLAPAVCKTIVSCRFFGSKNSDTVQNFPTPVAAVCLVPGAWCLDLRGPGCRGKRFSQVAAWGRHLKLIDGSKISVGLHVTIGRAGKMTGIGNGSC